MTPDEIQTLLKVRPFAPFRLCLPEGVSYEVHHPEMVLLGRRSLTLGLARTPEDVLYERTVILSLLAIGHIETMPRPTAQPPGNGQSA